MIRNPVKNPNIYRTRGSEFIIRIEWAIGCVLNRAQTQLQLKFKVQFDTVAVWVAIAIRIATATAQTATAFTCTATATDLWAPISILFTLLTNCIFFYSRLIFLIQRNRRRVINPNPNVTRESSRGTQGYYEWILILLSSSLTKHIILVNKIDLTHLVRLPNKILVTGDVLVKW